MSVETPKHIARYFNEHQYWETECYDWRVYCVLVIQQDA
jgi:hypothetical protein